MQKKGRKTGNEIPKKALKHSENNKKMVILGSSLSVLTLNGNRFNSLIQKIQMS